MHSFVLLVGSLLSLVEPFTVVEKFHPKPLDISRLSRIFTIIKWLKTSFFIRQHVFLSCKLFSFDYFLNIQQSCFLTTLGSRASVLMITLDSNFFYLSKDNRRLVILTIGPIQISEQLLDSRLLVSGKNTIKMSNCSRISIGFSNLINCILKQINSSALISILAFSKATTPFLRFYSPCYFNTAIESLKLASVKGQPNNIWKKCYILVIANLFPSD